MKRIKPYWKVLIVIAITLFSWPLFVVLTYGSSNILHVLPLLILTIQIVFSFSLKNRRFLILTALNPVVFFAIFYAVKPIVNHLKGTPTVMKCCYNQNTVPSFDKENQTFLDYYDDDCDWSGLYHYTLDINNVFTCGLISVFGNPIKTELVGK